jgi:hypothetical protein
LGAVLVSAACAAVLVLAWRLTPDPLGHGTHEQMGLPACLLARQYGTPCMTCGMTTAFAHAADGDLAASLMTQPMGMLLSAGTAVVFWLGVYVAATGSRLGHWALGLLSGRWLTLAGVLAGAAWVYKIITWNPPAG